MEIRVCDDYDEEDTVKLDEIGVSIRKRKRSDEIGVSIRKRKRFDVSIRKRSDEIGVSVKRKRINEIGVSIKRKRFDEVGVSIRKRKRSDVSIRKISDEIGVSKKKIKRCEEIEINSKTNELLNLPFHLLEKIMEFSVGVDYLNFRATSKHCHLAAPNIRWNNNKRLQSYSLVSPWLVVFEKDSGIVTFTDPLFGDKYFMKASPELFYDSKILCSRFGWLLLFVDICSLAFFNPFTCEIRKIRTPIPFFQSISFSAPPTSPDCVLVATRPSINSRVLCLFYSVARDTYWRAGSLYRDIASYSFEFLTFCGRDVYALSNTGKVEHFQNIRLLNPKTTLDICTIAEESPTSHLGENFLVKCNRHLLKVILGESVDVFMLNEETKFWEKMDSLGTHMIYISDTTCLCMDANTPEMENKIYFSRLHSPNGNMVFYSLETCRFHTFSDKRWKENLKDLNETKKIAKAHAWIEPSWS